MQFNEMDLSPKILEAITEMGFVNPTPIQEKIIPKLLDTQSDIIGIAQTGTGKTAAFGLPIIQQLDDSKKTQALILSPTRELAIQISKDLEAYSKFMKVNIVPVYGGASIDTQIRAIKKGAQVIVGTPGRTLDLIKRRMLKVDNIKTLVLDEADEMLNMGFKEELDGILETTPKERQTLLFSATMPSEIERIAKNYMRNIEKISVSRENIAAKNVEHIYYMVNARDKYLALKRIADINPKIYSIVFCRTRRETKEVADKLIQDGYNADALHGDLSQAQRDTVMSRFRLGRLQILVATDVAARGIDVDNLTHIINYNLPDELEIYIHRSGRTGRAGKKGISASIIHSRETGRIKRIAKIVGKNFTLKQVPGGKEICEKQLYSLIDKIQNIEVNESQIEDYLGTINEKLESLSKEDIIKKFVSLEFNRFLNYYKNAPDLNIKKKERGDRDDRRERGDRNDRRDRGDKNERGDRNERGNNRDSGLVFSRFFINIGKRDDLKPQNLIGLINENTRVRNIEIGKIDILKNFSFFETDSQYEKEVLEAFDGVEFNEIKLSVEVASPRKADEKKGGNRNDRRKRSEDKRKSSRKGSDNFKRRKKKTY